MAVSWIVLALGFPALLVVVVVLSYVVESLRPAPHEPRQLPWDPNIPVHHIDINGARVLYITAAAGAFLSLVLLHRIRMQLDIFLKMILNCAGIKSKTETMSAVSARRHTV